jgi:hypothetical protein
MADPDMEAKRALQKALAWAIPPRKRPTVAIDNLKSLSVTPQVFISLPTNRKPGRHIRVKEVMKLIIFWAIIVSGILGFMKSQKIQGRPREKSTGKPRNRKRKNNNITTSIEKLIFPLLFPGPLFLPHP